MDYTVTLIPGDGIGPEVTRAAQEVVAACGVKIHWERHDAGAEMACHEDVARLTTVPRDVAVNRPVAMAVA